MSHVVVFDDRPEPVKVENPNGEGAFAVPVSTGPAGQSVYELAVSQGYEGTLEQWLSEQSLSQQELQELEQRVAILEGAGPGGGVTPEQLQEQINIVLQTHVDHPTPHPAYDVEIPSLKLLFENGLV